MVYLSRQLASPAAAAAVVVAVVHALVQVQIQVLSMAMAMAKTSGALGARAWPQEEREGFASSRPQERIQLGPLTVALDWLPLLSASHVS